MSENTPQNTINSKWHLLKYALFAENPDNKEEIYCVNLLSGTWFILNREEFLLLFKINELEKDVLKFKKLIQQGIVINFDEVELMKIFSKNALIPLDTVRLTICPTIACNFNCPYCFENHYSGKMEKDTEDDILIFLKRLCSFNKIKRVSVTWYGGEPLLAPEVIESLSNKIINFTKENNLSYNASIVTNGYLLDQKKADMLSKVKVFDYQITLDGIGEIHNRTRHLVNNGPTFDVIISNLKNTKIKGHINIRHNVYEDNKEEIDKLKELIKNITIESGNNINYYSVPVIGSNVGDKRKEQVNFLNLDKKSEIEIIKDAASFSKGSGYYCGSQVLNFIVIDNNGRLYKCWEDVDKPERSYGDVKTWDPSNPYYSCKKMNVLLEYLNSAGAFDDIECQECIWLPFCRGGCPNKRIFYKKKCVGYKNNPEDFVLKVVKMPKNERRNFSQKFCD